MAAVLVFPLVAHAGERSEEQQRFHVCEPGESQEHEVRSFESRDVVRRKRMGQDERRNQIVSVAAKVIAAKGFWGMSLQDVADEIGITESALYHYIRTKNDLLRMVIEQMYDSAQADEYIYGHARGEDGEGKVFYYFPRFCLDNVMLNINRPEMVKLFSILNAEALSPEHPAHEYFIGRNQRFWSQISSMNWILPKKYLADPNRFHHLWTLSMSAMDGLQLRWLSDSSANLTEEWLAFSEELFPDDGWKGFLDPAERLGNPDECLCRYGLLTSREADGSSK